MTNETATLTDEQWIALLDYRDRHGRTWSFDLWAAFTNGTDADEPHGPALRAIRNGVGPSYIQKLTNAELKRQRERFTLTRRTRSDDEVRADMENVAASLAADDREIWANMSPTDREPYIRRAGVILISLNTDRRQRERGL